MKPVLQLFLLGATSSVAAKGRIEWRYGQQCSRRKGDSVWNNNDIQRGVNDEEDCARYCLENRGAIGGDDRKGEFCCEFYPGRQPTADGGMPPSCVMFRGDDTEPNEERKVQAFSLDGKDARELDDCREEAKSRGDRKAYKDCLRNRSRDDHHDDHHDDRGRDRRDDRPPPRPRYKRMGKGPIVSTCSSKKLCNQKKEYVMNFMRQAQDADRAWTDGTMQMMQQYGQMKEDMEKQLGMMTLTILQQMNSIDKFAEAQGVPCNLGPKGCGMIKNFNMDQARQQMERGPPNMDGIKNCIPPRWNERPDAFKKEFCKPDESDCMLRNANGMMEEAKKQQACVEEFKRDMERMQRDGPPRRKSHDRMKMIQAPSEKWVRGMCGGKKGKIAAFEAKNFEDARKQCIDNGGGENTGTCCRCDDHIEKEPSRCWLHSSNFATADKDFIYIFSGARSMEPPPDSDHGDHEDHGDHKRKDGPRDGPREGPPRGEWMDGMCGSKDESDKIKTFRDVNSLDQALDLCKQAGGRPGNCCRCDGGDIRRNKPAKCWLQASNNASPVSKDKIFLF